MSVSSDLILRLLRYVTAGLAELAELSETDLDDKAIAFVRSTPGVLEYFADWIASLLNNNGGDAPEVLPVLAPSECLQASADEAGVDWAQIVALLPTLIQLLRPFLNRRKRAG